MKLSEALEHQERIKRMTAELNMAIDEAMVDGLSVDVDIIEHHTLRTPEPMSVIKVAITVNPEDIE
ncbi:hypothetical protein S10a_00040 [Klebsiella phage VLCpiS10a]|nr:hypothetical protein S10a_00040 [Klebsiella phage VLCpiS10a]